MCVCVCLGGVWGGECREKVNGTSIRPPLSPPRFLTVCLAPTHGPLRMRLMREFVEYHLMIGVDQFVFYDAGSVDNRFHGAFAKETEKGVVEVTDFRMQSEYKSWYFGQPLTIQDCIYRTRYTSQLTSVADLDCEFAPPSPSPPYSTATPYWTGLHTGAIGSQ